MSNIFSAEELIWHPFTQAKIENHPIIIEKALGSYLYDIEGNSYLDLISSWWVNLHGHAHPDIAQAIFKQANILEHVIFAGFSHKPAIELSQALYNLLPNQLKRFFFSDNGSTAVEVALKMAYQYWSNKGATNKTKFISFQGGYHGDTIGAMSLGKSSGYHDKFNKLLFDVIALPYPDSWLGDENIAQKEEHSLQAISKILEQNHHEIVACILEPLVQGAGGMRICSVGFLNNLITLLKTYGILVIFDEVMTGFGRTGTNFAFQQLEYVPDFLCLSKGLTGGFLPLALTITSDEIYGAFLSDDKQQALLHGHSYTANPLGCVAAIASLELLLKDTTQKAIKTIEYTHQQLLAKLTNECKHITKPRILGVISAFDVDCEAKTMTELKKAFLTKGLLIRPLANTIYLLPPYSITADELEYAYTQIGKVANSLSLIKS